MRRLALVAVVPLASCGSSGPVEHDLLDAGAGTGTGSGSSVTLPTFQIDNPDYDVQPGDDVTFCYYFQTPNTADVKLQRWASQLSPGASHVVVYLTATNLQTPGTRLSTNCGLEATLTPTWAYDAHTGDAALAMPDDDGTGVPVGFPIRAGQPGFLQIHYVNNTTAALRAHVGIDVYARPDGVQTTAAGTFMTYNSTMVVKPGSPASPTPSSVKDTCMIPDVAGQAPKFFAMTTQTFEQGVRTSIRDGAQDSDPMVFEGKSWTQPGVASWSPPAFYTFSTGMLTYQCDYMNTTARTLKVGDNPAINENCMAVGYYFPVDRSDSHICLDGRLWR